MSAGHKILLLDDDQDLLELYREMLARLPSQPEIHTATSGARAIALLESEPFSLLISDLNMPKMDGLQVLTIVRRKFPQLRTAVMTSVVDAQFRTRAYAMGIDLFLEKPNTSQEITFFLDCIESLLGREMDGGFRGVQSKSLVDIIQLECLSQSSSVLKVTNGPLSGKIWFHNGDVIDAEAADLAAEEAFRKILSWKTGNFEILPAEPERARAIFNSYQGLLLESAQALDEAQASGNPEIAVAQEAAAPTAESPLAPFSRFNGVEFVMTVRSNEPKFESLRAENPEQISQWVRQTMQRFRALGDGLQAGQLNQLEGLGPQCHVALVSKADTHLCVGFHRSLSQDIVRDTMKRIASKWAS
ncbi:MAG TPA: response regulator [Candidatus Angelobacter sp.]|jgi:CheY-like chemotaxis protein|nr:response regulator [Candidatus Angelobacter sp.]